MELSLLVARIISIIYLSAGLGAIFSSDYYRRLVDDLFNNAALTYITGFIAVIVGFLLVQYHPIWVKDWRVLITIIGWLALIKGILIILLPNFVYWYSKAIFTGTGFRIFPYVAIVIGILFGYFGFVL